MYCSSTWNDLESLLLFLFFHSSPCLFLVVEHGCVVLGFGGVPGGYSFGAVHSVRTVNTVFAYSIDTLRMGVWSRYATCP